MSKFKKISSVFLQIFFCYSIVWILNQPTIYMGELAEHSCFRSSVNCAAPSSKIGFKSQNCYLKCYLKCAIAKHTLLGVIYIFGQRNNPYICLGWHNLKKNKFCFFFQIFFCNSIVWILNQPTIDMGELVEHSCFRSSLNVPLLQWKIGFKSQNCYLKCEMLLVFVSCSKCSRGNLGCMYWPQRAY